MRTYILIGTLLGSFWLVIIFPTVVQINSDESFLDIIFMLLFRISLYYTSFQILGYWYYVLESKINYDDEILYRNPSSISPKVAILIPLKNEPEVVINRMISHLKRINYPEFIPVFIDNSTFSQSKIIEKLSKEIDINVIIIRKSDSRGYKAGALNKGLSILKDKVKYILVLDIDHAPKPSILKHLVPLLEFDESLAFVQAPQKSEVYIRNYISQAYCFKERIFFDQICPGMSICGSLFITGTNVLFRRKALIDVGGFDETSLTEDIRTSMAFHKNKWKGIYTKKTVAVGLPPRDFRSYHGQQRRWAIGTFQNFFEAVRLFLTKPTSLKIDQWLLYLGWNGTFYFQGFFNIFLAWSSLIFLCSTLEELVMYSDIFPIFLILFTLIFQVLREHKQRRTKWLSIFSSQAIFFGNNVVFIKAFFDLLFNRNIYFQITNKSNSLSKNISFGYVFYHAAFVLVAFTMVFFSLLLEKIHFGTIFWPFLFSVQSFLILFLVFKFPYDTKLEAQITNSYEFKSDL